jgi:hypothetical protein
MAGNPRTVTQETWFTWDGVPARLPKGQAIDVVPGSALEAAIGRDRLVPLGATSALPPAEPPAKEAPAEKPQEAESPAAPPKPVAQAKKQDTETAPAKTDGKAGDP